MVAGLSLVSDLFRIRFDNEQNICRFSMSRSTSVIESWWIFIVVAVFSGVGVGYAILNGLVCIYYQVIIALSLYYLFASFQWELPWMQCDQEWNTPQCGDPRPANITNISECTGTIPFIPRVNWINDTFENSLENEHIFAKYLKESHGLCSGQCFSFRYTWLFFGHKFICTLHIQIEL